jgi:nucleoside-diphosphate-sugar epimerase
MRVIVTGGSGFIGTNLIEELLERKYEVVNLDIRPPKLRDHEPLWRDVSLLDERATCQVLNDVQPDYVIHAAARTDLRGRSLSDYTVNTTGTSVLISAAEAAGSVKRTLFISSMLVCRNGHKPSNESEYCSDTPYGKSKAGMENIVRDRMRSARTEFVILRPTSIWGPWFGEPYRQFFHAIRRGLYVHPGNGQVKKQFGYVGNVVDQMLTLLTARPEDCAGTVFYVGDYTPYIVREWADLIQLNFGTRRIRTAPLTMLNAVALAGDLLHSLGWSQAPLTSFRLANMLMDNSLPFEKTAHVCGALKYSLLEGVQHTVAWLDQHDV